MMITYEDLNDRLKIEQALLLDSTWGSRDKVECADVVAEIATGIRTPWNVDRFMSPWVEYSARDLQTYTGGLRTVLVGTLLHNIRPGIVPIDRVFVNYAIPSAIYWRYVKSKNDLMDMLVNGVPGVVQEAKQTLKQLLDVLTYIAVVEDLDIETNLAVEDTIVRFAWFNTEICIAYAGFYNNERLHENVDCTDPSNRLFTFGTTMSSAIETKIANEIVWHTTKARERINA